MVKEHKMTIQKKKKKKKKKKRKKIALYKKEETYNTRKKRHQKYRVGTVNNEPVGENAHGHVCVRLKGLGMEGNIVLHYCHRRRHINTRPIVSVPEFNYLLWGLMWIEFYQFLSALNLLYNQKNVF